MGLKPITYKKKWAVLYFYTLGKFFSWTERLFQGIWQLVYGSLDCINFTSKSGEQGHSEKHTWLREGFWKQVDYLIMLSVYISRAQHV